MKTVITFTVIFVIACRLTGAYELSDELKTKAKIFFQECVKQENVSEEDAARLRNKNFDKPSDGMKCFGTCFFEKIGTLKDNILQEDFLLQSLGAIIGEEKTKEVLSKCNKIEGANRCDTGFKVYECFDSYKAQLTA